MSNQYFQFKQFRIEQERSAMKVTTDACIQGAWTPVLPQVNRVLDVGAGTGILSLMLAQSNVDIIIDAIESDQDAGAQARDNVGASPWKNRINIIEGDVRNYEPEYKYDLIISNPPFFINSLLGENTSKNIARHTLSLTYHDLLVVLDAHINVGGYASIMLPSDEYRLWKNIASAAGWNEFRTLSIKHTPAAAVKRVVGLFSKNDVKTVAENTLVIKENGQDYSAAFTELLAPFYLGL